MEKYLQGFLMGLAYVAPIGVQNLFVINSVITQKRSKALLIALIVIFFDVTLALACFFGIGYLIDKLEWLKLIILLVGSIIIIYIGQGLLRSKSELKKNNNIDIPLLKAITSACVVTWFNPQAIIDGTMMLGAFRATLSSEAGIYFILGVTSASFCWFMGLSIFISLFNHKFNEKVLRVINIVCGIVIIFYGLKLLLNFYKMFIHYIY
ncbi:L-lysine permease [Fusobacterium hwasookii ChDC F174]|uniref:L-lysine permease n=1 Tax=Fusobacterium hwasookii ChDC F174 TaxID=1307442 RepID=A0A0S2ZJP2_9FUSO|nr:LysE/ArgO family amino acid transporter [Fusobacterium hwasookii]ALQ39054.1 L-lysine permease [Fusobacterium hwasookii ChDC F174]